MKSFPTFDRLVDPVHTSTSQIVLESFFHLMEVSSHELTVTPVSNFWSSTLKSPRSTEIVINIRTMGSSQTVGNE